MSCLSLSFSLLSKEANGIHKVTSFCDPCQNALMNTIIPKIDKKSNGKTFCKVFFVKLVQFEIPELLHKGIRTALMYGTTKEKYVKSVTGCRKYSMEIKRKKASRISISEAIKQQG